MYDLIVLGATVVGTIFPLIYAYKKKIRNPMLFIFSCIGGGIIITALFSGMFLAYYLMTIYIFPQAEALGFTKNIDNLLRLIGHIGEYVIDFTYPVIFIALPTLIEKRYGSLFKNKNT